MKVTTKDVEYIAQLSRLTIPEGEMEKFTEQFNQILNYADILQKLDTEGIEPTPYVLPISNAFREDVALPGVTQEEALKMRRQSIMAALKCPALSNKRGRNYCGSLQEHCS